MKTGYRRISFFTAALFLSFSFCFAASLSASGENVDREIARMLRYAQSVSGNLDAAKAKELMTMALYADGNTRIHECREICRILGRSKYASAESWALYARTYMSGLGDDSNTRTAQQYLDKAFKLNPRSSFAYHVQALMQMEEGDFEKALQSADKSLACPNPMVRSYTLKASALANLGRDAEALKALDKAPPQAVARDASYCRVRGNVLENLKRYDEAVACYRKGLSIGDTDVISFRLVKCLELQNKIAEAIKEIDAVIARNPKDGDAYRARANLKVKIKDIAGAIKDYDNCLAQEPTAKSFRERAKLHKMLGHKDLAAKDEAEAKVIEDRD